jgi:hypothetical protein
MSERNVLISKIPSNSFKTFEIIRDYMLCSNYNWRCSENQVLSNYLRHNTGVSPGKHGNLQCDHNKNNRDTGFKSTQVNNNNKMNSILNGFNIQQILIRFINIESQHKCTTVFYHKFGFPYTRIIRIVCFRTCSNTLVPTYNYLSWVILVQSVLFN